MALNHSRRRISRASRLFGTAERTDVLYQAPTQSLVPTHAIDVNGIGLRRADADVEGDVLALVDAGGGSVTFDLPAHVRRRRTPGNLPLARAGLLVFDHNRILGRHRGGQADSPDRKQEHCLQDKTKDAKAFRLPNHVFFFSLTKVEAPSRNPG